MSAERRLDVATGRYRLTVFDDDKCAERLVGRFPVIDAAESSGDRKNVGYGYEILDTETQRIITLGPRAGRLVDY